MSAVILKQVMDLLPVKTERQFASTSKVFSKQYEIDKIEELKNFNWIATRNKDEVFVEFTDREQAVIFYRSLKIYFKIIFTKITKKIKKL
jgi:hypothetical protein